MAFWLAASPSLKVPAMVLCIVRIIVRVDLMIAIMRSTRTMILTMHSTMAGTFKEGDAASQNAMAMGQAYDAAKNDDSFYLPPEIFKNRDFQRAMSTFLSPDGKAARFIISQRGDPATPAAISRVDRIHTAAEESLKGTPLPNAKLFIGASG